MKKTVLVTGANRGIGLEFVKQYASDQWQVLACCREPEQANELQTIASVNAQVRLCKLNIDDSDQIQLLCNQLSDTPIDCLINNAGVYGVKGENLEGVTSENMLQTFKTNVCATLSVCQSFLGLVARSQDKLIVTISSKMGSIAENQSGRTYAYRASKTALNAVMKSLSIDAKDDGISVLTLHPGWVKTNMGGKNALITPEESVLGMRKLIAHHHEYESGGFYSYDGKEIPW